jgi:hypothetical protein
LPLLSRVGHRGCDHGHPLVEPVEGDVRAEERQVVWIRLDRHPQAEAVVRECGDGGGSDVRADIDERLSPD